MKKENKQFNTMKELSFHIVLATLSILILVTSLPTVVTIYKISFIFAIMGILLLDFFLVVSNHKKFLKVTKIALISLLLCIAVVGILFYASQFLVFVDTYGVEQILTNHITTAKLLFFLICLFQPIFLPLPEALTIPAGSAVIGSFSGALIGFLGSTLGIVIMYFLARIGGLKLVSKFVKERQLKKYQEYVKKNETIILTLMFIIPILPDEIICVGAGISKVSFKKFLLIASITKLITASLLSYSVYLAKFFSLTTSQIALTSSILIVSILSLSYMIKRSINRNHSKEAYITQSE